MTHQKDDMDTASKPDAAPARTGWPAGMLQDDSPELSKALAGKPDARLHAREAAHIVQVGEQICHVSTCNRTYCRETGACQEALASSAAPAGGAEAQTVEALEFLFLAIVTRADSDYLFRAVNRANAALEVAMPGWTAPVPMTGWAALAAAPVVPPDSLGAPASPSGDSHE